MDQKTTVGQFVTLEGAEGAGKSSLLVAIEDWLNAKGLVVTTTREPGGTALGEGLRGLLLDPDLSNVTPIAELAMMFAARAQHVSEVIKPALARGEWVVCDRFTDSSYAYQGSGRGIDASVIAAFERLMIQRFQPDITFLLDVPVDLGLKRAGEVGTPDRFEREQKDFFERVRAGFLDRAQTAPRIHVIDATNALSEVTGLALGHLDRFWQDLGQSNK